MKRLAFVMLSGCNLVLGLSEPQQEGDAGVPDDAVDAPVPMPGTIRIVQGGTHPLQGMVTSEPAGISCPGTCEFTFPIGTEVTLSSTIPATANFTGFFQGGCTGGQTCTITPSGTVEVFARYFTNNNIWFTSSELFKPGAFDGVANADKECDRLAAAAGLPERDYIAWLPSTTKSAMQHLFDQVIVGTQASVWLRPDGEVFAVNATDIQQGLIRFPPRLDELGRDVGDDARVVTDTVGINGTSNAGTHCSDWASESAPAVIAGEPAGGTGRFTEVETTACDKPIRMYCLSAIDNAIVPVNQLSDSIIYQTFGTVRGNAGVGAMDALCESEGSTLPHSTTRALVTPGANKSVKDRFVGFAFSPDPVMRRDGVVIAPNMDALLAGGRFDAAPNVVPDFEYRNDSLWVGGPSFDVFDTDCNGWTTQGGFGTAQFSATTAKLSTQESCNTERHILCFRGLVAMAKPAPAAPAPKRR